MTPAETYAQKRLEAIELIQTHAPARLQDPLIALLRPAIALSATRMDDAQIPLGASKFGGAPDVPAGFKWPTWNDKSLGFLAQINLEEVAEFDVEELLPKSGLLSFFYFLGDRETDSTWGAAKDKEGWRVLWFDNTRLHRAHVPPYFLTNKHLTSALLNFEVRLTLPTDFECYPQLGLNWENYPSEAWQAMDELGKLIPPLANQIFGNATCVQRHPGTEVEQFWRESANLESARDWDVLKSEADRWILLFQMDSEQEAGAMWGDCGNLYFMLRPEDLTAHRFENTWFSLQCS